MMIRHSSTVVLLHWLRENVSDEERASVLFSTSINFDVSVAEVFGTLAWGGKLVLVENALELASVAEPVIHASMVPTAAAELLRTGGIPASVRTLNLGGEPLPSDLAQALYALPTVRKVGNLYGPTEDTTYSTYSVVKRGGSQVFVGRPVANTRALVLDAELEPVPLGVVGELYLAGDGLSRGYAGAPEMTAERYLPDPHGEPGSRMYRVMDRVRWRADGELEYFGRTDFQVKVRGFRIELGEIEAALRSHPAVREAVALVREDEPGERRIAAYLVPADGAAPDVAELRAHLRERVPEYMLPSAYVVLERLPQTPNGKVDRRALPAPEAAGAGAGGYAAPRTPTEEVLAGLYADVLGAERVDAHADFFDLGGHSLLATRVVARAREAFGVDVELAQLFEAPSVAALAARVDALLREGAGMQAPPIVPVPRDGELPLSFAQQRLWFIDQLQPGSAAYNIPAALRIRGPLDAAALERALAELVRRHEALRTTFASTGGRAVQVVHPAGGFTLPRLDLGGRPEAEREAELRRLADADEATPFDLSAGPLLRALLVRLADEEHALLVNMHHIVSDGWSVDVMVREVAALYNAFCEERPSPLPELPVQYADYAAWQRAWLTGETLERQLGWWRERLAGAPPVLELPTDRPRPRLAGAGGSKVPLHVPVETADALRALSRREGATLYMTLMAGWQALLGRHAGQTDVVVGMPVAGRNRAEVEGLIGFFVNTLVIRTDLADRPDARALVRRVRATTLGAHQHQDVPFERLVEELGVERSLDHTPLFQVVFNLRNPEGGGARLAGAELEGIETSGGTAKFDLTLTVADDGRELGGSLGFRTDLFDAATMERMLEHFVLLLRGMAESPDAPLATLPILAARERHRVLVEWNATGTAAPPERCVHELFEAEAALHPEAQALAFGEQTFTYGELDALANRLARHLRGLGVGPETAVGVYVERSPEMVVALLGILKAGGAYVPLDPAYPADRIAFMLEDSGAPVLVTQAGIADALPADGRVRVRLDADRERIGAEPSSRPEGGAGPESLAYMIYTSGSTGRPRGVRVEHAALANLLWSAREAFGLRRGDVMACVSSPAFDIWLFEALAPLVSGGVVRVLPLERVMDVEALAAELSRATMFNAVTSLMSEIVRVVRASSGGALPGIRAAFVGGEAVAPDLLAGMRAAFPAAEIRVLYGPTEGTVLASSWRAPGAPVERVAQELERAVAEAAPDDPRCIHHLVQEEARRAPDAVAVSFAGERVTYAELDARANRLANHLRALGVGPESRVGVCLERTPELVVALLATLKAGAAYVPLDPAYPAERQLFMLEDAGARVLLTQERLAAGLGREGMEVVRVDADRERIAAESAEAPESGVRPDNLAYVIYTSGSTGRPKGVAIQHRSTVVMLRW
ncbi:MAG TPA: AMP-binding protein, partial [Longimicrobiaceae bacterium]|nr:AMP-binding protein [Longimicrobiaceae bacterium]